MNAWRDMKVLSGFSSAMVLTLGLFLAATPARAQIPGLTLGVSSPTNPIRVNNQFSYRLNLTNLTGIVGEIFVTNSLPATVQFVSATNAFGTFQTNGSIVTFVVQSSIGQGIAQMTLTVRPTTAGSLTNIVTISVPIQTTNTIITNIVTVVTNVPLAQADLAVSITNASQSVIVNDLIGCGVVARNLGTNSVSNVVLTNEFSSGVTQLSISPSGQTFTTISNALVFNLGSLTNSASRGINFFFQPTNAGTLVITASVGSTNISDSNLSNNTAVANIVVSDFLSGDLVASNVSAMVFNPQNALMEQTIRLSNIGTNAVPSARVMVTGLTNVLYNAVGTNNGNPYVVYGANLNPGQSVDMVLEYFVPTRMPIPVDNTNYIARGVPAVNLSAPADISSSVVITNITSLPSGNILIEFTSIPNRSYTIFYSDNSSLTNMAQPPVVAQADKTQWIDDGPPKTISHPTNTTSRFYRVLLNP